MISPELADKIEETPELMTVAELEAILDSTSDEYYHLRVAQVAIDILKRLGAATSDLVNAVCAELRDSPRSP